MKEVSLQSWEEFEQNISLSLQEMETKLFVESVLIRSIFIVAMRKLSRETTEGKIR